MAIASLLGTLSGLYCKISIALFVLGMLFFYQIRKKHRLLKRICSKREIILMVISYLVFYIQIIGLENSFEQKYQNIQGEIEGIGTIVSNPIEKEYQTSYTIKVKRLNGTSACQNTKILLKVKKDKNTKEYFYGNEISFKGEWKEPSRARNEGGFDYKQYLKTKKIYGMVETQSSAITIRKENDINGILKLANIVQHKIKNKANELLEEEQASVLVALLIGNKEGLEEEVQEAFRMSNLSHMLAVSGAHVSYVMLGIGFIIANSKISKKVGKIITIVLLVFFLFITGQTPSVTRACIMSIYFMIASLCHKRVSVLSSISISFLTILLLNPYAIWDVGLQLSYGGTIGIIALYKIFCKQWENEKNGKIKNKIAEMLFLTLSANLILIPVIAYHYHTLSLTFPISNLLASPIMGILVIAGFITIFFSFFCNPIAKLLAYPLSILLQVFLQIANMTSKLPFSQINVAVPNILCILLYYLILCLFLYYQKEKHKENKTRVEKKVLEQIQKITMKKIVAMLVVAMILLFLYQNIPKSCQFHFIDVGQGDSMLVTTPTGKTMLIDGGGQRDTKSFDVGKNTLLPYLLKKRITKIDFILVSHFDTDHVDGLLTIMKEIKVKCVVIGKQFESCDNYEAFIKIVKDKKIKVHVVEAGQRIKIEKNLYFDILWPSSEEVISENSINNNSLVCKLSYQKFSILFTGDIEEIAEKAILEKYKGTNVLQSTILKVAHHGSKSSSTEGILEAIKPKIALIGVGKNNTFGHPNVGVLKRIEEKRL